MSDLVTRAEAAKILGKSKSWLQWAAREGKGPPYQVIGGRYLYPRRDVELWLSVKGALARGVEFIAYNDEPGEHDLQTIASSLSVVTLAEACSCPAEDVARLVLGLRVGSTETGR